MIKVFVENQNHKIELTKEELQRLLDEAYNEGLKQNIQFNLNPYDHFKYDTKTNIRDSETIKAHL